MSRIRKYEVVMKNPNNPKYTTASTFQSVFVIRGGTIRVPVSVTAIEFTITSLNWNPAHVPKDSPIVMMIKYSTPTSPRICMRDNPNDFRNAISDRYLPDIPKSTLCIQGWL